jgi:hypothetical protein
VFERVTKAPLEHDRHVEQIEMEWPALTTWNEASE